MKSIVYLLLLLILGSCAHIVPPEGGRKDEIPPKLVKSSPPTNSVNYRSKKIILTFDENIQIVNLRENFSVTPDFNEMPRITANKNKVNIFINIDSLKPNTSYTLNFGKSIADLNESNVYPNFTYSFSTGSFLDTQFVEGKILEIKTNLPKKDCIVNLVKKENNLKYSVTTDDKGEWKILNLSSGQYDLLIFIDKDQNKKPGNGEPYFKTLVTINDSTPKIIGHLIPYFVSVPGNLKVINATYIDDYSVSVKFNQAVNDLSKIKYSLTNELNKKENPLIPTLSSDSFIIIHPFLQNDSINLNIFSDTLQTFLIEQPKKRKIKELKIEPVQVLVRSFDPIFFKTNIPVKSFGSQKINVNGMDSGFIITKINAYKFKVEGKFKEQNLFIFNPGAITDINGLDNKPDTFDQIRIASPEQTGNYEFTVKDTLTKYKGNVIVKIFNDNIEYIVKTRILQSNTLTGLLPGNYTMEVWYDLDNDEVWDQGDYSKSENPETIRQFKDLVLIKANWDTLGVEIYMD